VKARRSESIAVNGIAPLQAVRAIPFKESRTGHQGTTELLLGTEIMNSAKRKLHDCVEYTTSALCGAAINYCREYIIDGSFWAGNSEYESQVRYCPFCGKKAMSFPELKNDGYSTHDGGVRKWNETAKTT